MNPSSVTVAWVGLHLLSTTAWVTQSLNPDRGFLLDADFSTKLGLAQVESHYVPVPGSEILPKKSARKWESRTITRIHKS